MAENVVGKIDHEVLKATVKIETSANTMGTGFIVSKRITENRIWIVLITNKHMIGRYNLKSGMVEEIYDFVTLNLYRKDKGLIKAKIPLRNVPNRVHLHPDPFVDIAAIAMGDIADHLLSKVGDWDEMTFDFSLLATDEVLKNWYVDIGDQVFALGYPFNIYSTKNHYPLAKSGYISSKIGEELEVIARYEQEDGQVYEHKLVGKLILLDGTLVNGNSGGPIILPRGKREITIKDSNQIKFNTQSIPNFIIAIQSQSFLKAGISIAFSAEYIRELIDDMIQSAEKPKDTTPPSEDVLTATSKSV